MQYFYLTSAVLSIVSGVLAAVEVDARFYNELACVSFGIACTNLGENLCCSVSNSGTKLYDSGDFFNDASGMGVNVKANFFSLSAGAPGNDCNIVLCGNIGDGVCCEGLSSISGATYTQLTGTRDIATPSRSVEPDSYFWVEDGQSYYVSIANETNHATIRSLHDLSDFTNLGHFMKRNADVIKSESGNVEGAWGRKSRK